MGYYINLTDSHFYMDAKDKPYALAQVPGPTDEDGGTRPWMHHVDTSEWDYLTDAMEDWRFPVELDGNGNVVDIRFTGEKIGDEREMFEAIAEYIQTGSYVEFVGEDGKRWKYLFTGDSMEKVSHQELVLDETEDLVGSALDDLKEARDGSRGYLEKVESAIVKLEQVVE